MEAISGYSNTPTYSLTRLLLAGSSSRSALLAGAHEENSGRVERASRVLPRRPGGSPPGPSGEAGRQISDPPSPHGPAAIFEPSDHALATVLRSAGKKPRAPKGPLSDARNLGKTELTEEEQKQVDDLKKRDQEVRRHEQAHKAAAGANARGGPTFEYKTGPDGKRYAVGGEVPIELSPVEGNPRATIAKMQQVRRAALAPSDPSGQDRAVAARAAQAERKARQELTKQQGAQNGGAVRSGSPSNGTPVTGYTFAPPGQLLDTIA